MIITIEGKPSSGKSILAEKICLGKEFVLFSEHNLKSFFWTTIITETTEVIIVDDVVDYEYIYSLFSSDFLTINRRGNMPFKIKMPTIILIKSFNNEKHYRIFKP